LASDGALSPPAQATLNGVPGGNCPGTIGSQTEYEEGLDYGKTVLDGGASQHKGQAINPNYLPRDPWIASLIFIGRGFS